MICAQGLLRLLWGGPKLECYGTAIVFLKYVFVGLTSPKLCSASDVVEERVRNILSTVAKFGNNKGSSLLLRNCAWKSLVISRCYRANKQICTSSALSIDKSSSLLWNSAI